MKFLSSVLLLAALIPAQVGSYGGPQYSYNSLGQLVDFTAVPYGTGTIGTTVLYTSQNQGASFVLIAEGLTISFNPLPFGTTQLVDNITSFTAAGLVAGSLWVGGRAIPLNPSLIGSTYFAQFLHIFPAYFAGSHGIQVTIQ